MKTSGPPSKGGPEQHKNDLGKSITSSIAPASPAINITNVIDFEAAKIAAEAAVDLVPVLSEDTIAHEFAVRHFDKARFNSTTKEWHLWNGNRWKSDKTRRAFDWSRRLVAEMGRHEDASIKRRLGSKRFADGVEGFARTDQALAVTFDHWDQDLDVLGTPSGIVDLRTGELFDPDPEYFITRSTGSARTSRSIARAGFASFIRQPMGTRRLLHFCNNGLAIASRARPMSRSCCSFTATAAPGRARSSTPC
jgi:hypothetical protein